ncbi:hypothetical protein N7454_005245 [Penicillium verhagenii]|nr:hypothetical protein N7454_005245 [Penicillium verhagenii]
MIPEHLRPYLRLNQNGAHLTMSKNSWTTNRIGQEWGNIAYWSLMVKGVGVDIAGALEHVDVSLRPQV